MLVLVLTLTRAVASASPSRQSAKNAMQDRWVHAPTRGAETIDKCVEVDGLEHEHP
jgi:hypothetical protein